MRIKPIKITLNGQIVFVPPVKNKNAQRDSEILSLFADLKDENPNATPFTLCRAIESMQGTRAQTVYTVLRKYGRI